MNEKELWLQNSGSADRNLGDLGIKIPAGKTVNVFKVNQYLTEEKVKQSMENGSLSKYLAANLLKVVARSVTVRPPSLDHIKKSDKTTNAKKTKSSVVIDTNADEVEEGEKFDFADYGVNDVIEHKKDGDAVIVTTKEEPEEIKENNKVELKPKEEMGQSKQVQIVMDTAEKAVNPVGPLAEQSSLDTQPFVIVRPPAREESKKTMTPLVDKNEKGQVKPKPLFKRADDEGNPDSAVEFEEPESGGMRVATKTKDGAVIMELKEDIEEDPDADKVVVKKKRPTGKTK